MTCLGSLVEWLFPALAPLEPLPTRLEPRSCQAFTNLRNTSGHFTAENYFFIYSETTLEVPHLIDSVGSDRTLCFLVYMRLLTGIQERFTKHSSVPPNTLISYKECESS